VASEQGVSPAVGGAIGAILEDLAWTEAPTGEQELHMLHKLESCLTESAKSAFIKQQHEQAYQAAQKALLSTKALSATPRIGAQKLSGAAGTTAAAQPANVLAEMHAWLQATDNDTYRRLHNSMYAAHKAGVKSDLLSVSNAKTQLSAAGSLDYLLENFQYRYTELQDYLATYDETTGREIDLTLAAGSCRFRAMPITISTPCRSGFRRHADQGSQKARG
jgi:hypothetical protein